MRQAGGQVPSQAHELVKLVPEKQETLHGYFGFTETSDFHDWRTFSDQFL